jgi:two-component system, NtrC family, sensor kinase
VLLLITMETDARDLILVVSQNPDVIDLIGKQTLDAAGYRIMTIDDIDKAHKLTTQHLPDCLIADLTMPGLNGKDLMVMLQSQGLDVPVIVLAAKGSEKDIIQSFRLGADDYLQWPIREPEALAVIERVLKHVHTQRQRRRMEEQVQRANDELQLRVRELTTIYALGKAMTSTTDLGLVSEKVLEGAVQVTQAERGWLLLRDEATKVFYLVAHRNLPSELAANLHKPWDDGISLLVARSGKALALHGDAFKRFEVSRLGNSVLSVPVKAKNQVIGLLVMLHSEAKPFSQSALHLIEAVADYASIALVNARLFLSVEERLRAYQVATGDSAREKVSPEKISSFNKEQGAIIEVTVDTLERLASIPASHWTARQREALIMLRDQVEGLIRLAEATAGIADE